MTVGQERRRLILSHGDITERGDAGCGIVTSANQHLAGNGQPQNWVFRDQRIGSYTKGKPLRNVDGAVHAAGGPELLAACQELQTDDQGMRCPTGEARATPGFNLPACTVIHTVGPKHRDEVALQRAHVSCLRIAEAKNLHTVFFPAIGCGVYGFPVLIAAEVALKTVEEFLLTQAASVGCVEFVLWEHDAWAAWTEAAVDLGLVRGG